MPRPDPDDPRGDISDDIRELAGLYLSTRRADLVRLDAALAAGDLAVVRSVGHAFKGSSAPFGFPEAGRLGAELVPMGGDGPLHGAQRDAHSELTAEPLLDDGRISAVTQETLAQPVRVRVEATLPVRGCGTAASRPTVGGAARYWG